MRRLIWGGCLLSLFLACYSVVYAQKIIDKDQINSRIKELQNRIKTYYSNIRKPSETVELKLEKISEELENRKDVVVTVLFHDTEMDLCEEAPILTSQIEKQFAETVNENNVAVSNTQKRLEEINQRKAFYDSLRTKIKQATRRVHTNACEINRLIAQISEAN